MCNHDSTTHFSHHFALASNCTQTFYTCKLLVVYSVPIFCFLGQWALQWTFQLIALVPCFIFCAHFFTGLLSAVGHTNIVACCEWSLFPCLYRQHLSPIHSASSDNDHLPYLLSCAARVICSHQPCSNPTRHPSPRFLICGSSDGYQKLKHDNGGAAQAAMEANRSNPD